MTRKWVFTTKNCTLSLTLLFYFMKKIGNFLSLKSLAFCCPGRWLWISSSLSALSRFMINMRKRKQRKLLMNRKDSKRKESKCNLSKHSSKWASSSGSCQKSLKKKSNKYKGTGLIEKLLLCMLKWAKKNWRNKR